MSVVKDGWDQVTEWLGKALSMLVVLAIIAFVVLIIFWLGWVTYVDKHELGFIFDRFEGTIEKCERTGYIVARPIKYEVHKLDLRPQQIKITAFFGNNNNESGVPARILNAKLVKFNPDGLDTFVKWHGVDAGDKIDNLRGIMLCYAFDKQGGKDCPFIEVVDEINPSQAQALPLPANKNQ